MNWTEIDTAVKAALAAQQITCYEYEGPALSKVPCATFVPDDPEIGYMGSDQRFGLGSIGYKLRYYVSLEKDAKLAWTQMKDGITAIITALGNDRDLGGAVRDLDLRAGRIAPVRTLEGGRRELMCEFDVTVKPKPN